MTFFTEEEFTNKYENYETPTDWQIEAASEMIFSQVGLNYRDNWDSDNVPVPVKNAAMEQMRYMLDLQIPFIDNRGSIKAGVMTSDLKTDYSTLALRILANAGMLYRGVPMSNNMSMNVGFNN